MDWNEIYSVGNPELDSQHQGLFRVIGDLGASLNDGHEDEVVKETLAKLIQYTADHFQFEEEMMHQAGYAGLEEHRNIHRALKEKLEQFSHQLEDGRPGVRDDLYFFLISDWLASHILGADKDYAPTLQNRKAAP